MLAAVLTEFGKPLSLVEVPNPSNSMKVGATGLCHGDLHILLGEWSWDIRLSLPIILGHEIAVVKEGKTYLVYNARGCGNCKACKSGNPQYCERLNVIGVHRDGGFAERVDVSDLLLAPVNGSPAETAPLADAGVTAVSSVHGIIEGDRVGVLGTGAVALLSVQLLRNIGAEVWVVGRNQAKLKKAKELGADELVFSKGEYSTDLSGSVGLRKFDFILDYVGSDNTLRELPWLLERTGELRVVGEFGGELKISEQLLVLRGLRIRGVLYGTYQDLLKAIKFYEAGKLKTLALPYSLKEINTAISDLMEGKIVGRAVIYPDSDEFG
ncbi:alcohol dehydrogenase catalytic domain-containing protein [Metallosphaera hakonensis]|uniref:Alcohol dehydrogenase n=1 Tax=Metallosphaera hakonensis JCM 8857 = DSM 7519 TaxID=1293036 RepID=A0A2U9IWZ6_9CREN|nr:zinc-binding dehydrogenase [Metallosphaera hakonensis]AWS00530.1 alcohol dehydrogenase catalytic domain-containing protein [Metallosphaera hakonensis JCM 8857 = DSM 7519]